MPPSPNQQKELTMNTKRVELQVRQHEAAAGPYSRKQRKCPVCPETPLVLSDHDGVEVDNCPRCRGVWLDRGELDKIIERSAIKPPQASVTSQHRSDQEDPHRGPANPRHDGPDHSNKRPRSWLRELFD